MTAEIGCKLLRIAAIVLACFSFGAVGCQSTDSSVGSDCNKGCCS